MFRASPHVFRASPHEFRAGPHEFRVGRKQRVDVNLRRRHPVPHEFALHVLARDDDRAIARQ